LFLWAPPSPRQSPFYTSVINERHFERVRGYVAEAEAKGVRVLRVNGGGGGGAASGGAPRRMAPTLVFSPPEELAIATDEIFGPPLIVRTYDAVDEAVAYVNAHPRPLALYYFGTDAKEEAHVLSRTVSGGACVNDVIMQVAQEDIPFGGVGPSGYGSYHGIEGFKEFSNLRGVHRQLPASRQFMLNGIYPPYAQREPNPQSPGLDASPADQEIDTRFSLQVRRQGLDARHDHQAEGHQGARVLRHRQLLLPHVSDQHLHTFRADNWHMCRDALTVRRARRAVRRQLLSPAAAAHHPPPMAGAPTHARTVPCRVPCNAPSTACPSQAGTCLRDFCVLCSMYFCAAASTSPTQNGVPFPPLGKIMLCYVMLCDDCGSVSRTRGVARDDAL
jgi:hypothetical protein